MNDDDQNRRPRSRWAAVFIVLSVSGFAVFQTLTHPNSPLPGAWNPLAPFEVKDPHSPLTAWKLRRVLNDPALCLATLGGSSDAEVLDPLEESDNCHIRNRVALTSFGDARMDRIETSCATALRLVLWERHGVQSAARRILGTDVGKLHQIGSYNCRPIRSANGTSNRWSTHATADAIDITGFDLADGRRIRLVDDWDEETPEAMFLRSVRDSACIWFATTLSPDYNSLHADHFHLQARGWGTCR